MDPTYLLLILAPLALIGLAGGGDGGGGGGSDDDTPSNAGDDQVSGTTGDDIINLGDGDDEILSVFFDGETAGNDIVRGEGGNDILFDPDGSNELDGGDGRDSIIGFDREGSEGADLLIGGNDIDRIYADNGDTVRGGEGNDSITVLTDPNADPVIIEGYGEGGADDFVSFLLPEETLPADLADFEPEFVQDGDNVELVLDGTTLAVFTDISAEDLREASGLDDDNAIRRFSFREISDDISFPDFYLEPVELDDGGDRFVPTALAGTGFDIRGGDGDDRVFGLVYGDTRIFGGEGDDAFTGGTGDDLFHGEAGDDRLNGGFGDDELRGGGGEDTLTDNRGADTLVGGDGDDRLSSLEISDNLRETIEDVSQYGDRLEGGAGDDQLISDSGDVLNGGTGADRFVIRDTDFDEELGLEYEPVTVEDFNPDDDVLFIVDENEELTSDDFTLRQSGSSVEVLANGRVYAILENITVADLDGTIINDRS